MIAIVFTMKAQDGKGAELEGVIAELAGKVRANEPGVLLYQLTKSRTDPNTYKMLEMYKDQDAFTAHGQTDYMKTLGPKLGACFAGRPEAEFLDAV